MTSFRSPRHTPEVHIWAPLLASRADFEQGRATVLDVSRLAEQAADAVDNANARYRENNTTEPPVVVVAE